MAVTKKNTREHMAAYLKGKGVPENVIPFLLDRGLRENGMQSYNELIEGDKSERNIEKYAIWLERETLGIINIEQRKGIAEDFKKEIEDYKVPVPKY